MTKKWNVLVVGGAGYVGSNLVPKLLKAGHKVTVLDLYLYGDDVLKVAADNPGLTQIKGDMRDPATVKKALNGCDAVIHLACISNDPSFELNPDLGKSINYDCFRPLVKAAKEAGVKRFIYASSSSVYGIKEGTDVTEDLALEPLTDYSKYKALCEEILLEEREPGFVVLILRPATVCGYSSRLRLDLTVNILTHHAITKGKITVFGGNQMRPNIHIEDMTDLYAYCLQREDAEIDGKTYNAGYENYTVSDLANMVKKGLDRDIEITITPSNDNRSYHVSSKKIQKELGFTPKRTIEDAVRDLKDAFESGLVTDPDNNILYYNIKLMQSIQLV